MPALLTFLAALLAIPALCALPARQRVPLRAAATWRRPRAPDGSAAPPR
ncbi:hypothetical protein [Mangrovicoccus algicola]|uniref:Uncharacterized protein n=1 Tax=Mangrovicoccus algicola TaxID=2771008 RepID=A0A8J6YXH1_9RHOB|nr:hypothetical protein [Mangrovicoccus algicola]MBE3638224.1 hypothetical protein [Mangrovicoccus algicola]